MKTYPLMPDESLGRDEAKQFYTPGEVAKMFGVTPKTVSNWCEQGRLPFIVTPSGHRRIPVSAFKGGREYDEKKAALKAKLAPIVAAAGPIDGDAIAAEIVSRRHNKAKNRAG